eukprot:m.308106 g.308106  ORF g.308106 m.308106 type:complete len:396 (-) comp27400_c1_seq1:1532-2719(-)
MPQCARCGENDADLRCSRCKAVHYCNQECQRLGWAAHKSTCSSLVALVPPDGDRDPAGASSVTLPSTPELPPCPCAACATEVAAIDVVWCRRCRDVVDARYCSTKCKAVDADAHRAVCNPVKKGVCPSGYTTRGCTHYERGCALISGCCKAEYGCRMCHDEDDTTKCDERFDRTRVTTIVCLQCRATQPPANECTSCGSDFGVYCCLKCRMFSDVDEGQFHCDGCGICRKGGQENFVHCDGCGMCLGKHVIAKHKCRQDTLKRDCPICLEHLFESVHDLFVPPMCGHVMHMECFRGLLGTSYKCPICTKSLVDMNEAFAQRRQEIAETPMPVEYREWWVTALCSDCGVRDALPVYLFRPQRWAGFAKFLRVSPCTRVRGCATLCAFLCEPRRSIS